VVFASRSGPNAIIAFYKTVSNPAVNPSLDGTQFDVKRIAHTNKSDTINVPVMATSKRLVTLITPLPESRSCLGLTSNSGHSFFYIPIILTSTWKQFFPLCQMMPKSMA
jgi:hypothetical protein